MSHRNRLGAAVRANLPTDLGAYARALRPLAATLRWLADDATQAPGDRVHTRAHLRRRILRVLRELDARIAAADAASPEVAAPTGDAGPAAE